MQIASDPNNNSWAPLKTVTGNTVLVNDHTGLSGSGRYVRVYGTQRGTPYGYSIYELEVYGTSAGGRVATEEAPAVEESATVFVYPNPATDRIRVEGLAEGTPVTIASATGSGVYTFRVEGQSVDISRLPAGVYVFTFRQGQQTGRKKLIKR